MLLHYLAKRRNKKITFSLKCCISALPEFNQLFDVFNLFDSRLILTLLYDSLRSARRAVGGIVQEKGSRERCRSWTVLYAQCTSALSSGFPIFQRNAEALERWGGKTKHRLICFFLGNMYAKNYRSHNVCVKIIASQSETFFETRYTATNDVAWDITFPENLRRSRCISSLSTSLPSSVGLQTCNTSLKHTLIHCKTLTYQTNEQEHTCPAIRCNNRPFFWMLFVCEMARFLFINIHCYVWSKAGM